jgi:hypothetical protein
MQRVGHLNGVWTCTFADKPDGYRPRFIRMTISVA